MSCDKFLLLLSVVGSIIGVTDMYDDDDLLKHCEDLSLLGWYNILTGKYLPTF